MCPKSIEYFNSLNYIVYDPVPLYSLSPALLAPSDNGRVAFQVGWSRWDNPAFPCSGMIYTTVGANRVGLMFYSTTAYTRTGLTIEDSPLIKGPLYWLENSVPVGFSIAVTSYRQ